MIKDSSTNNFDSIKCEHAQCQEDIMSATTILKCSMCDYAYHQKCAKLCTNTFRNKPYCANCIDVFEIIKYNPYYDTIVEITDDMDSIHNDEPIESSDMLEDMSCVLEACKPYCIQEFIEQHSPPKTFGCFSCSFLNIDLNARNFDSLAVTLAKLNHTFDVIGIAETNVVAENKDLYLLDGYTSLYQNKIPVKRKGSEVALYISQNYITEKMESQSIVTKDIESLFAKICFSTSDVCVGVIYRPPGGNINIFNESLAEIMKTFNKTEKVHIMGDFNINLFRSNTSVKTFEETFMCNSFSPTISITTHNKPNCKKSCIDNILTKDCRSIISNSTIESDISHHKFIFNVSKIVKHEHDVPDDNRITISYCYSKDNLDKLEEILRSNLRDNPPTDFSNFNETVLGCIDEACKLKIPKITKRNKQNNPWISIGLINAIAKRDRLYHKWRKSITKQCNSGNIQFYEDYRKYRNILYNLIKKSKRDYYNAKFSSYQSDKKKIWTIINSLRGKSKQKISPTFNIDNSHVSCRKVISNKFNSYFSSLAINLNKNIDSSNDKSIPSFLSYLPKSQDSSLFLSETSGNEIIGIINELKNGKSSDIPINVIKYIKNIIAPHLSKLFNSCMAQGTFPSSLKTGRITPIHKKGPKYDITNYRPV